MEQVQFHRDTSLSASKRLTAKIWIVAMGVLIGASSASACSGVGPPGKPVVFGDQTNIVIWDEEHQMEHFIRNANFKSGADNFGFIAPTPGKPELSEASTKAFNTLASLAPPMAFAGGGGFGGGRMATKSMADQVQVIQEADVAGYHAATLLSESSRAINDWMNEHGYVSTPEVEKWATRYCSRGWYLTAFKVVDKTKLAASTGTVRMSFRTQRAFNPFYVPKTNIPINGGGTLRVYFVAVGDYEATIGSNEIWQRPQWSAPIPEATGALLAKQVKIPAESVPDNAQVETFVDNNFPRPAADDIYFAKRRTGRIVTPEHSKAADAAVLPSPAIPFVLGLGILGVAAQRRRTS